jgi:hypothetical protein
LDFAASLEGQAPDAVPIYGHEATPDELAAGAQSGNPVAEGIAQAPSDEGASAGDQLSEQAPAAPNVAPPRQPWEDIASVIKAELPTLKALLNTPKEFRESAARLIRWIETAAASAPPEWQPMCREAVGELNKWVEANSPEKLKKRSLLQKAADWLSWRAQAAQLQQKVADTTSHPQPASHQENQPRPPPVIAVPLARPQPLFVPLAPLAIWTPDLELITFNGGADRFTLSDATEGVAVFGSTGSGKTSGSGQTFACSYLSAGFGGLVLTAKVDECDLWRRYAAATDRTPQLCVVRPGGKFKFNFLDYQTNLPEEQGGIDRECG